MNEEESMPAIGRVTVEKLTGWDLVYEMATSTGPREPQRKEPSSSWKSRILDAEHSPVAALTFAIRFERIPSYVSVHFVRHKMGVVHFVQSQREDRSATGTPRHDLPQDAPIRHKMVINALEIMSISRRRLCNQASTNTRLAWRAAVQAIRSIGERELADKCVPMCIYRGGICHEMRPCGKMPAPEDSRFRLRDIFEVTQIPFLVRDEYSHYCRTYYSDMEKFISAQEKFRFNLWMDSPVVKIEQLGSSDRYQFAVNINSEGIAK